MKKRVERLRYNVAFNLPGDGDCFNVSTAKALGIETQGLKKVIFDFLKSHQFDMLVQPIANSPGVPVGSASQNTRSAHQR